MRVPKAIVAAALTVMVASGAWLFTTVQRIDVRTARIEERVDAHLKLSEPFKAAQNHAVMR